MREPGNEASNVGVVIKCMPRLSGHFVHLGVWFRFRGGFINHNIITDFLFLDYAWSISTYHSSISAGS